MAPALAPRACGLCSTSLGDLSDLKILEVDHAPGHEVLTIYCRPDQDIRNNRRRSMAVANWPFTPKRARSRSTNSCKKLLLRGSTSNQGTVATLTTATPVR